MTEPINLEYNFTEKEYVLAIQAFYSRFYHTLFWLYLSGFVFLLGLAVTYFFGASNIYGALLTFVGFTYSLSYYHTHFVLPRQYFQRNPQLRQSWSLQCAEDNLFFSSSNAESRIEWSFFREIWETSEFYFLMNGRDTPTIIKKQAFIDIAQEAEFRDLIKRKINPQIQGNSIFERIKIDNKEVKQLPRNPPDWR